MIGSTVRCTVGIAGVLLMLVPGVLSTAQVSDAVDLPAYEPERQVGGVIRIWGHGSRNTDLVGGLVRSWENAFRKYQPEVQFDNQLLGNASAIGGLYTGKADLALMGREIWPTEIDGFQQVLGLKPFTVSVMTGSLDVRGHNLAVVIFVHRDNPLSHLTLAQVDAVFGADHRRSAKNTRVWGDLGLTGEWARQPIHLYGYRLSSHFSRFFEQAALAGSEKWNCNLRQIADPRAAGDSDDDAGQLIIDALSRDRYGIAISGLAYQNAGVKPLALAPAETATYYEPSRDTVAARQYPLTRSVSMFMTRVPGKPLDPKLKEFLEFILSSEGQALVVRDGGYLPLTPLLAEQSRRSLE